MTKARIDALQQIAALVLDQHLSDLRQANARRDETRRKLAALDQKGGWADCSLQASAKAAMLYQAWADVRRRELNQNLARQTVAVMSAEDASRLAFGRHSVLNALKRLG
jgi:hypothetical protein